MSAGALTSVELTALYLNRVSAYDGNGTRLNAVPVINPRALEEAAAADLRRLRGEPGGALLGIPYTVKDSYKVKGLTVAGGSPAFAKLIANEDAFTVQQIRSGRCKRHVASIVGDGGHCVRLTVVLHSAQGDIYEPRRARESIPEEDILTEGVDIMVTVDVSGSMAAEDFRPRNRL